MSQQEEQEAIAIIGAGPAGLLTAYYQRERGYSKVYVLEKLDRVGGLCKTVTKDNHSFDLGANYVVPSYREVLRIAKKLGVQTYPERQFIAMTLPEDPYDPDQRVTFSSIFSATRKYPDGRTVPLLRFFARLTKYMWLRFRMRDFVNKPTLAGVEGYQDGELTKPFDTWLEDNGLIELHQLFLLPITMMGFGRLDKTPANYALKFMELKAFVPNLLKEVPFFGRFVPWPKRFAYGYQRLWERLAWGLNVRINAHISSIVRGAEGIVIKYRYPDQAFNDQELSLIHI